MTGFFQAGQAASPPGQIAAAADLALVILFFTLILFAAWWDITAHRIPNWLTAGSAGLGLLLSPFVSSGASVHLIGFAAALAGGILLWLLGTFRAGDAKLFAALGMIMGGWGVLNCFLWSMLTAGGTGLILMLRKGILLRRLKRLRTYVKGLFLTRSFQPYTPEPGSEHELPLGPFIAAGAVLALCLPLFPVL